MVYEWHVYGVLARDVRNALYPLLSQCRQAQIREALADVCQVTAS
jgi:hypothetical protein